MKSYIEEKRIRPHVLTTTLYVAVIIMMFYNIIAIRIFGDKGVGFSSLPISLYLLFYVSFILAVQKAVYIMVRLRARRSQFINAETNMVRSMRIFTSAGIIIALLLTVTSYSLSKTLLGSGRVYIQIIMVCFCLILMCSQGVIRGYLQGLGYTRPLAFGDMIVSVTATISGAIISFILYNYGEKVNKLFHGDEYSAIYGASGMVIGLMIGTLVGFGQTCISMALRKHEIAAIVKNGAPRYLDNKNDVLTGIRSIMFLYASPVLMSVADHIGYNYVQLKKGGADIMVESFGAFTGRVISPIVLISVLCCIPFIKSWNRVMARIERDELEGARDRLKNLIHSGMMLLVPVTVFHLTMGEYIQDAVFGRCDSTVLGEFQLAAPMILLLSVSIFLSWILNHMGKSVVVSICLTATWITHVILFVVFVVLLNLGIIGVELSMLCAFLVYFIMSTYLLFKMLKYKSNVLRNMLIPLLASAVSGLILMFVSKLLITGIGEVLTIIIGALLFTILYIIIMILLKGIRTHELENVPFGRILMIFAHSVQRDKYYED